MDLLVPLIVVDVKRFVKFNCLYTFFSPQVFAKQYQF